MQKRDNQMKVLAVNGSPRKNGNTAVLIETALVRIRSRGIETETLGLSGLSIHGCIACYGCKKVEGSTPRCTQEDKDDFRGMLPKFLSADGIILGSPVYFGSATPEIMALIHRAGYAIRSKNKTLMNNKVGTAVVVARRAGQNFTLAQLNFWFQINGMIMPGASYWNMAFGNAPGEVKNDKEGMATMEKLGDNIADLLTTLKHQ
jgi:multimeric flavodoxin WrbA